MDRVWTLPKSAACRRTAFIVALAILLRAATVELYKEEIFARPYRSYAFFSLPARALLPAVLPSMTSWEQRGEKTRVGIIVLMVVRINPLMRTVDLLRMNKTCERLGFYTYDALCECATVQ